MVKFSNIIFVLEEEIDNSAAFELAVTLAKNHQAKLSIVGTVNISSADQKSDRNNELLRILTEQRQEQLESIVKGIKLSGEAINTKVLVGRPFVEIIREAIRQESDLIIKTVKNPNPITRYLFTASEMKLLRKCPCPVWLVKPTEQIGDREILVALDYQPEDKENEALNQRLLALSISLALADFGELHVVHAWKLPYESYLRGPHMPQTDSDVDEMVKQEEASRRQWLADEVDKSCKLYGEETMNFLKPQFHLVQGDAKFMVPNVANEIGAELVVMGTVGRAGIPGLLIGNTAENILNQLECSVLAIKPEQFISPIMVDSQ